MCQKRRATEMAKMPRTNTTMGTLGGFDFPKRGESGVSILYTETPCDANLTETKCRKREANKCFEVVKPMLNT